MVEPAAPLLTGRLRHGPSFSRRPASATALGKWSVKPEPGGSAIRSAHEPGTAHPVRPSGGGSTGCRRRWRGHDTAGLVYEALAEGDRLMSAIDACLGRSSLLISGRREALAVLCSRPGYWAGMNGPQPVVMCALPLEIRVIMVGFMCSNVNPSSF